jgi:hypothetical protein
MQVTGHANPQSVKPYLKNTYYGANMALTMRQDDMKIKKNMDSEIKY